VPQRGGFYDAIDDRRSSGLFGPYVDAVDEGGNDGMSAYEQEGTPFDQDDNA
jgi:hypothetical protein